jgi:hypothetical protein
MVSSPDEVDEELTQDIKRECARFGPLLHVQYFVEGGTGPQRNNVNVAVEYDSPAAAQRCVAKMNGRYFAGRVLTSGVIDDAVYQQIKKEAVK